MLKIEQLSLDYLRFQGDISIVILSSAVRFVLQILRPANRPPFSLAKKNSFSILLQCFISFGCVVAKWFGSKFRVWWFNLRSGWFLIFTSFSFNNKFFSIFIIITFKKIFDHILTKKFLRTILKHQQRTQKKKQKTTFVCNTPSCLLRSTLRSPVKKLHVILCSFLHVLLHRFFICMQHYI